MEEVALLPMPQTLEKKALTSFKVLPRLMEAKGKLKVPPRFELGSLDSESRVLTITP